MNTYNSRRLERRYRGRRHGLSFFDFCGWCGKTQAAELCGIVSVDLYTRMHAEMQPDTHLRVYIRYTESVRRGWAKVMLYRKKIVHTNPESGFPCMRNCNGSFMLLHCETKAYVESQNNAYILLALARAQHNRTIILRSCAPGTSFRRVVRLLVHPFFGFPSLMLIVSFSSSPSLLHVRISRAA